MLRTRVVTALALLLLLVATAAISPQALLALAAAFLGMALYEWLRLGPLSALVAALLAATTAGSLLVLNALGWAPAPPMLAGLCALASIAWLGIGLLLVLAQRSGVRLTRPVLVSAALGLSAVAWLALADLLRQGPAWTLSVLALVWLADIAAYFSGRAFGRRKLATRISPGKTWAGVWGAMAAVLVLAELARWLWPQQPLWSTQLLLAAPLEGVPVLAATVAISIVGDLFESLVKRQGGVKDSGWILPGHGGVWDRIDASLPVLPLAVLSSWIISSGWIHG